MCFPIPLSSQPRYPNEFITERACCSKFSSFTIRISAEDQLTGGGIMNCPAAGKTVFHFGTPPNHR